MQFQYVPYKKITNYSVLVFIAFKFLSLQSQKKKSLY